MTLVEKLREYAAANICRDGDDMDCPCRCGDEMKEAADRIEALEQALREIKVVLTVEHSLRPDYGWKQYVTKTIDPLLTSHLPSAESEQSAPPER